MLIFWSVWRPWWRNCWCGKQWHTWRLNKKSKWRVFIIDSYTRLTWSRFTLDMKGCHGAEQRQECLKTFQNTMDIQYILPPLSLFKTNNSPKMYIVALMVTVVLYSYSLTLSRPPPRQAYLSRYKKGELSPPCVLQLISHTVTCYSTKAGCDNCWKISNHADVITTTVYIYI